MLDQAVTLSARGLRVLLIEDSPVLRGMVLEYLKASAFVATVEWADTEDLALRLLEQGNYDVVIVDLQLRQGNGFKVLQTLRDQASPSVRIVYTNHAQVPTYRQRCFEAGANYFFDKSLELDKVFEVIEERAGVGRPRPQPAQHFHP
ncbi:Sensor histidine kinase RcsC [Ralstonia sp. LMG 32965]|uniref:Sensor histidine kinase RcsC n=1 Tax=Ralstonia flatus TaxID=3058601 RepID=A0AAD2C4K7_9RALS|nr:MULTISPECIES: response regulator [unclassified Ralstonia]MBN6208409.1 response regulator [Ralstonia pickettii]CAJ0869659.1 Sensor histidine kinase RcsC [Ralstonia sp. LMG 32965]CAJ0876132.1 Sensor histidine kinase RcsC [Ralstonia sp. LMG 32965]CAJ0880800.1 Sensor histidine kinase RcsC [Ralstonia sp. LMG 32965]